MEDGRRESGERRGVSPPVGQLVDENWSPPVGQPVEKHRVNRSMLVNRERAEYSVLTTGFPGRRGPE
jgi:hypothetical protein